MTRPQKNKNLTKNKGHKGLDISINMSHNRVLPDKGVIQLVKILARQAAEMDYMHPNSQNQNGEAYEKAR